MPQWRAIALRLGYRLGVGGGSHADADAGANEMLRSQPSPGNASCSSLLSLSQESCAFEPAERRERAGVGIQSGNFSSASVALSHDWPASCCRPSRSLSLISPSLLEAETLPGDWPPALTSDIGASLGRSIIGGLLGLLGLIESVALELPGKGGRKLPRGEVADATSS